MSDNTDNIEVLSQDTLDENLRLAVIESNNTKVQNLIANGAKVNSYDLTTQKTPLILAIEINRLDIVKTLIDNGADVDDSESRRYYSIDLIDTPLKTAIKLKNPIIVKLLIAHGAYRDYEYDSLLSLANNNPDAEISKLIFDTHQKVIRYKVEHPYLTYVLEHPELLAAGIGLIVAIGMLVTVLSFGGAAIFCGVLGGVVGTVVASAAVGAITKEVTHFFAKKYTLSKHVTSSSINNDEKSSENNNEDTSDGLDLTSHSPTL
jgi:hypothetical protein